LYGPPRAGVKKRPATRLARRWQSR